MAFKTVYYFQISSQKFVQKNQKKKKKAPRQLRTLEWPDWEITDVVQICHTFCILVFVSQRVIAPNSFIENSGGVRGG
jgi:hypothetical protein